MIMAAAEEQQKPYQYQDQQQQQQQKQDEEDKKQKEQEDEEEDEESPPESPPSKVARVSPDESSDAGTVTTAVASPLLLGLGLGTSSSTACACACGCWGGFTFMQIQEFHHQALIFKHMVAGIPVPIHLILPIWKSVAASYGPHHYPSFVGLGKLCYDFRNSMEQEPGRCRRTDGKKWRCSRDVVPDQKYCERHMHRGRSRSRKPVEGAAPAPSTNLSITIPDDDGPTNIININSSSDVPTAAAAMIGSSPISVLSSRAACKTGAA